MSTIVQIKKRDGLIRSSLNVDTLMISQKCFEYRLLFFQRHL